MEEFITSVLAHEPGYKSEVYFSSSHLMLSMMHSGTTATFKAALDRLQSDSEVTILESVCIVLNLCISDPDLGDDILDTAVEQFIKFGLNHPNYEDGLRYICAFLHYQCSNELAVAMMQELDVIPLATNLLKDFGGKNADSAAAAFALLSHFNCYPVGDVVIDITQKFNNHRSNKLVAKLGSRALAEYTYSWGGEGSSSESRRFIDQVMENHGLPAVLYVMENFSSDETVLVNACRILSNIGSVPDYANELASKQVVSLLGKALGTFAKNEVLVSHGLHAIATIPLDPDHYDRSLCEGALNALGNFPNVELVQTDALRVCGNLATLVKETKSIMNDKGIVSFIINAMKNKNFSQPVLLQEACNLFSYLAFDSEAITMSITTQGGIQLVIDALAKFPSHEVLQTTACAALSGLTFNNTRGQMIVHEHRGLSVVLDAMRRGKSERLHEMTTLAVGTMCWNVDLKAEVVRLRGIDCILSSIRQHETSPNVVKNAARALAQIAFNSEPFRDEMSKKGAISDIIRVMQLHSSHDRVQMHCCVALSYLSWTNDRNATTIVKSGGYDVIIDAMDNHPTNAEVQEHACRALANISSVMSTGTEKGIKLMVQAMKKHDKVPEVQEEASRAIVTLSLVSPKNKDLLHKHGASGCVVAALKQFSKNSVVQQEASNALAHLAYEHTALNKEVTSLGGVQLLLTAMTNYSNSVKVQLNACGGLSALAFDNPMAQQQIFEANGVPAVIHAMRTFDKLRILELGCSVLGTLAWNSTIKEKVAVEAIPEILRAMRAHQDNALLQKSTCRAISQFAFNSEVNRRLLFEADAIPHIVLAVRNHISHEKLISHAIVAFTYLCWENAEVADSIVSEGTVDILNQVKEKYSHKDKIANKADHLLKILTRKSTPNVSPNATSTPQQGEDGVSSSSAAGKFLSPPEKSPLPFNTRYKTPKSTVPVTPAQQPSPHMGSESGDVMGMMNSGDGPRGPGTLPVPGHVTSQQMSTFHTPKQREQHLRSPGGGGGAGCGRGGGSYSAGGDNVNSNGRGRFNQNYRGGGGGGGHREQQWNENGGSNHNNSNNRRGGGGPREDRAPRYQDPGNGSFDRNDASGARGGGGRGNFSRGGGRGRGRGGSRGRGGNNPDQ